MHASVSTLHDDCGLVGVCRADGRKVWLQGVEHLPVIGEGGYAELRLPVSQTLRIHVGDADQLQSGQLPEALHGAINVPVRETDGNEAHDSLLYRESRSGCVRRADSVRGPRRRQALALFFGTGSVQRSAFLPNALVPEGEDPPASRGRPR